MLSIVQPLGNLRLSIISIFSVNIYFDFVNTEYHLWTIGYQNLFRTFSKFEIGPHASKITLIFKDHT